MWNDFFFILPPNSMHPNVSLSHCKRAPFIHGNSLKLKVHEVPPEPQPAAFSLIDSLQRRSQRWRGGGRAGAGASMVPCSENLYLYLQTIQIWMGDRRAWAVDSVKSGWNVQFRWVSYKNTLSKCLISARDVSKHILFLQSLWQRVSNLHVAELSQS